jgi:hypothetical protein
MPMQGMYGGQPGMPQGPRGYPMMAQMMARGPPRGPMGYPVAGGPRGPYPMAPYPMQGMQQGAAPPGRRGRPGGRGMQGGQQRQPRQMVRVFARARKGKKRTTETPPPQHTHARPPL